MNLFAGKFTGVSNRHTSGVQSTPIHSRPKRGREGAPARPTRLVAAVSAVLLPVAMGLPVIVASTASAAPVGQGFNLNASDLRFILKQIKISEEHARTATTADPCGTLLGAGADQIPNQADQGLQLPWGLRTVDGSCNNLIASQNSFATALKTFPRLVPAQFKDAQGAPANFFGPGTPAGPQTSYTQTKGSVFDAQPRLASNLVVDQTAANPAAVAAGPAGVITPAGEAIFIPNTAPDVGLSAPYNSWFTMFGQFFDHGLDLTSKSGGNVFMPLQKDDPLFNPAPGSPNFMVLTRSTNQPGPDGIVGDNPATPLPADESADDIKDATNQTSSFVDQSQTYTSHPSHQVFLREYANNVAGPTGRPVSTGKLITGPGAGMADWTAVKAQARTMLGIQLLDKDVLKVPLLATDAYGKFTRGPNGYPQMVVPVSLAEPDGLVDGDPAANAGLGVLVPADVVKSGQAFLDDIAHHAVPGTWNHDGDPATPRVPQTPDLDAGTTDDLQPGTYDDEMLNAHFMAGDGRVNENIALTAVHTVFHSEHNRLALDIQNVITTEDPAFLPEWQSSPGVWNGERLFQAARFVTEMEYQHLAFEEFARKVQPMVNLFAGYDTSINSAITAEFAHAVYRFGHSMLTETVARTSAFGVSSDIPLLDAFLNPPAFLNGGTAEQATGSIVRGMSQQVGNELDEFVTEALRNRLLGLPLDLAALNMARARETGTPPLNAARRAFFAATGSAALAPYANWNDFGLAIKHPESLINFVAAYGTHPTILAQPGPDLILADDPATVADESADNTPPTQVSRRDAAKLLVAGNPATPGTPLNSVAFMEGTAPYANAGGVTTTGLDDVDLWIGGLAEKIQPFGGMLGSTFNFVFETQMEKLQDGDRFYYLSRTAGLNMLVQLEGNSFAELIQRNSDMENLPADSFSRPDFKFDLANQNASGPIVDDLLTPYPEHTLLIRMADNTIRFNGPEHAVFGGTPGNDKVWSSEGDDTLRGNNGDDKLEGGAGNDALIGGLGDDILTDLFGDDVLKGGDGNDAMASGQGFDLNQPGRGNDFVVGGSDPTETFGAAGNDFIFGGDATDTVFGDDGDDWIEGGGQADLLQGDNGAPFQDDPNTPGHDVIDGQGGADDFDSEGGDDIMVSGPGVERSEGMLGFDWVTHESDPTAANSDLNFTGLLPPSLDALRDRFDLVEGLSGWTFNDQLRGDSFDAVTTQPGNELNAAGIARINGLDALLPAAATSFTGGNILIGGAGSDTLEGRGGNDIIDGDRYLNVRISVRSGLVEPTTEIQSANNMSQVQAAVFAGTINPGQLRIVREILTGSGGTDTALFSGPLSNYTIEPVAATLASAASLRVTQVGANVVGQKVSDGIDALRNIEQLQFSDGIVSMSVPAAPVIATATAGSGTATVTWTAPAPNGSPAITGYEVVVNVGGVPVRTITGVSPTATSLVVTGLTNGTTYTFQVRAVNVFGAGPLSAPSNAVTPAATVPSAPTGVAATAGVGSATVSWTAPASDGGSPITASQIDVRTGTTVTTVIFTNPATSQVVTGLLPGTTYTFVVRAVNGVGPSANSVPSNAITTFTVPGAPVIGTATRGAAGGAITALANWTPPASTGGSPITGYVVTALRMSSPLANATVLSSTASAVQPATARRLEMTLAAGNYRFVVVAINAVGTGPQSAMSNNVVPR